MLPCVALLCLLSKTRRCLGRRIWESKSGMCLQEAGGLSKGCAKDLCKARAVCAKAGGVCGKAEGVCAKTGGVCAKAKVCVQKLPSASKSLAKRQL